MYFRQRCQSHLWFAKRCLLFLFSLLRIFLMAMLSKQMHSISFSQWTTRKNLFSSLQFGINLNVCRLWASEKTIAWLTTKTKRNQCCQSKNANVSRHKSIEHTLIFFSLCIHRNSMKERNEKKDKVQWMAAKNVAAGEWQSTAAFRRTWSQFFSVCFAFFFFYISRIFKYL